MRLSRLTQDEQLITERRRLGLTQKKMAKKLKIKPVVYAKVEDGSEPSVELAGCTLDRKVTDLTPGERCFILRRRAGKTQADIAAAYGSCKTQIQYIEQGKADATELEKFWRAY